MSISLKNQKLASSVRGAVAARSSVKKPWMLALAALAMSAAAPAFAANWWDGMQSVQIGQNAKINVRSFGALGDGVHDDTAAFQAAINSLPADGGTVNVPAGHYMINATKAIYLRSHTRILMDSNATLEVIPTTSSHYWIFKVFNVNNVRIVGGNLVGDRINHKGTTGEWGFGIDIQNAQHVVVKDVKLSNFWGDGIWIGATGTGSTAKLSDYVAITNVVSSNNRRQGLSIGPATHVYISGSTFKDTNGTLPQAGLDIEPQDQGVASTVRLENNIFSGNRGNGIELHYNIKDITITGNSMLDNRGFGVLAVSAPYVYVTGNTATRNGLAGVGMAGTTHDASITGNTLQYNSTRYMSPTQSGGALDRDLQLGANTARITVSGNHYSNPKKDGFTQ